jgi:mannan endo-1,4-beta-mannosidase
MSRRLANWLLAFVITGITSSAEVSPVPLTDLQATAETSELYSRLQKQSGHGVFFGHQDTTAYGVGWKAEPGWSDVQDVC